MDNNNDTRQKLTNEKDKLRQNILDSLRELYFLRNNGQICDFQVWSTKDSFRSAIPDLDDDSLKDDQKFTQLLNLKYEEPVIESTTAVPQTPTTTATTLTTTTTVVSSAVTQPCLPAKVLTSVQAPTAPSATETSNSLSSSNDAATSPVTPSVPASSPAETISVKKATTTATTPVTNSSTTVTTAPTSPVVPSQLTVTTVSSSTKTPPATTSVTPSVTPPPSLSPISTRVTNISNVSVSPSKEESPTRISRAVDPIVNSSAVAAESIQRQNVEKAKHEHAVLARVSELRRQGLWSAQRLPKAQEPARPKCHWDFLLEEARWLFSDYRYERKWKRDSSRRLAYAAHRFINSKRTQQERLEKEKLQHLRKVAATLSKEVRSFWTSIEKIVDFRQQTKLEETRKKAWDLHLNYILDETSKFSNSCIEEFPAQDQQATDNPENRSSNKEDQNSDTIEKKEPVINVSTFDLPYNGSIERYIVSLYPSRMTIPA